MTHFRFDVIFYFNWGRAAEHLNGARARNLANKTDQAGPSTVTGRAEKFRPVPSSSAEVGRQSSEAQSLQKFKGKYD